MLGQKRIQAISILKNQLNKSDSVPESKLLQKASTLFFTDQTLKEFELAKSNYFSGTPDTAKKFIGLAEVEPFNLEIKKYVVLSHLKNRNCDLAKEEITRIHNINYRYHDFAGLVGLAQYCSQEPIDKKDLLKIGNKDLRLFLTGYDLYIRRKYSESQQWFLTNSINPFFPASYYLWKMEKDPIKKAPLAKNYLAGCQNLSISIKRKFATMPFLCEYKAELEEN